MIAALLAVLISFAHAVEVSPADGFKAAAFDAAMAVGKDGFKVAYTTAQFRCTDEVDGCGDVLASLKAQDAAARAPVAVAEVEDEDEAFYGYAPLPVDQPTGLEYVASTSRLPAPWTGFEVSFATSQASWVEAVCLVKEGAPLPLGAENPVSFSAAPGQPVFSCPSFQLMYGGSIMVPPNTEIYLMTAEPYRQTYVVREIRRTPATVDYRKGGVQRKLVVDLQPVSVRR